MASSQQNTTFRDSFRDLVMVRDDMETHITHATMIGTSDELIKLKAQVAKTEKVMAACKDQIDKRLLLLQTSEGMAKLSVQQPQIAGPPPPQQQQRPESIQGTYAGFAPSATERTQAGYVSNGSNGNVHQNIPPKQPSRPQSAHGVATQFKVPDVPKFRKNNNNNNNNNRENLDIPDSQRVFLPTIGRFTMEEKLADFFSNMGQVIDVKIFSGTPHSAAVAFTDSESVKNILKKEHFSIDGLDVLVQPYGNKENLQQNQQNLNQSSVPNLPPVRPQSVTASNASLVARPRYQVFLGGVPANATTNEIRAAVTPYGKVRDVHFALKAGFVACKFAFVDFENDCDADNLIRTHFVYISGSKVECKRNLKPELTERKAQYHQKDLSSAASASHPGAIRPEYNPRISTTLTPQGRFYEGAGDATTLCVMCQTKPASLIFGPCGHMQTCGDCGRNVANNIEKCPKCGLGLALG